MWCGHGLTCFLPPQLAPAVHRRQLRSRPGADDWYALLLFSSSLSLLRLSLSLYALSFRKELAIFTTCSLPSLSLTGVDFKPKIFNVNGLRVKLSIWVRDDAACNDSLSARSDFFCVGEGIGHQDYSEDDWDEGMLDTNTCDCVCVCVLAGGEERSIGQKEQKRPPTFLFCCLLVDPVSPPNLLFSIPRSFITPALPLIERTRLGKSASAPSPPAITAVPTA